MKKVILFVDGDNIDESYTQDIFENAQKLGEVYEAHCFSDFVKRKQRWECAYTECKTQLHFIPGSEKQKGKADPNTSDIAMAVFVIEKMYECPELDVCIIVANDKDYIPLAKEVREKFHKEAVMFYTQQSDKAIKAYDNAVLLKSAAEREETVSKEASAEKSEPVAKPAPAPAPSASDTFKELLIVLNCIEEQFQYGSEVLLSELGPVLVAKGINYGKSLGKKYLKDLFESHPWVKDKYVLKLGDKKDRIERITK